MSTKLFLFHQSKEEAERMAREMIPFFRRRPGGAEFLFYTPHEVFARELPGDPDAVFFTLCDARDVQAMEAVSARYGHVPLVLVGARKEWVGRTGGRHHLLRSPVKQEELRQVLKACIQRDQKAGA